MWQHRLHVEPHHLNPRHHHLKLGPCCLTTGPPHLNLRPHFLKLGYHHLNLWRHHLNFGCRPLSVGVIPSARAPSPQYGAPSPQRGHHPLIEHPNWLPSSRMAEEGGKGTETPPGTRLPSRPPQAPPLPARRREGAGPGGVGGAHRDGGRSISASFPSSPPLSPPVRVSIRPGSCAVTTTKPGGGGGCSPRAAGPLWRRPGLRGPCRGAPLPPRRGRCPESGCAAGAGLWRFPSPASGQFCPQMPAQTRWEARFFIAVIYYFFFIRGFAVLLLRLPPEWHVCRCPSSAWCVLYWEGFCWCWAARV